ncbi:hypothetical protein PT276_05685 [Orbaceae bacterium ESL0721]|nr:hypothetical protein [Orbaceae bacterium ESL0721]
MNKITTLAKQWQPYLVLFDVNLQPVLAELLSQLYLLLDPIKENYADDNDWHSGLGEIKPRGHYENLLLSEWLLFDSEPDEFLRRAINHEHLFLAPAPEEQKANGAIIALFDASVLQLGKMRIIHLVMMILLAHRADKNRSQFYWGVIQHPAKLTPFAGLDSLLELLNSRSDSTVNPHWSTFLNEIKTDERWFIGAKMTSQLLNVPLTDQLCISQSITLPRQLTISIQGAGKVRTHLLKLPNDIICNKIILGQLTPNRFYAEVEQTILVPISTHFQPIISMNGNQVAALTEEGKHLFICSLSDPISVKQKAKISFPPLSGELLAVDSQHKRVIGLINRNSEIWIWQPKKGVEQLAIKVEQLDLPATGKTQFIWLYDVPFHSIYLIDKNQTLWRSYINNQSGESTICELVEVDKNVLALYKISDAKCLYVTASENGELRVKSPQIRAINYPLTNSTVSSSTINVTQILLADAPSWLDGFGTVALGVAQDWQILTYTKEEDETKVLRFTLPPDWRAWGLFYQDDQIQLLLLHHDGKKVALFSPNSHAITEIYHSRHAIVQYHFSLFSNSFTLITEVGELILYSFRTESVRLIVKNREAAC